MPTERAAYVYPHRVAKVFEADKTVSGHKDEKGETIIVSEKLGWFIALEPGGIAYPVGDEKPALKVGDHVELVLRPVDPPAAAVAAPAPQPGPPAAPAEQAREVANVL